MIKEKLNKENKRLGINPYMPAGRANRRLRTNECCIIVDNIALDNSENLIDAFFLPWRKDTGYYIDLPQIFANNVFFFTAELTGCCVGVQRLRSIDTEVIRICHYNIQGKFDQGEFDAEDFARYNNDTTQRTWLLPDKYKGKVDDIKCEFYSGYSGGKNFTTFWGEYNLGWKFYYQLPTRVINDFLLL